MFKNEFSISIFDFKNDFRIERPLKRGVAYYMGYLYNNLYYMGYIKKALNEAYGFELFISCQIG